MKTYQAGENVKYGIYVAPSKLDFRLVGADGENLEGIEGAKYWRLPILLMLAISPALGGVFVLLFPVIVLAIVVMAVMELMGQLAKKAFNRHAPLAVLRWNPTAAYLNRKEVSNENPTDTPAKK